MPSNICEFCKSKLVIATHFKKQCIKSNEILLKYFNIKNHEPPEKEFTKLTVLEKLEINSGLTYKEEEFLEKEEWISENFDDEEKFDDNSLRNEHFEENDSNYSVMTINDDEEFINEDKLENSWDENYEICDEQNINDDHEKSLGNKYNFSEIYEENSMSLDKNDKIYNSNSENLTKVDENSSKSTISDDTIYKNANVNSNTSKTDLPKSKLSKLPESDIVESCNTMIVKSKTRLHSVNSELIDSSNCIINKLNKGNKSKLYNANNKEPIPVFSIAPESDNDNNDTVTGKTKSKNLSAALDESLNVERFKIFNGKRVTYHKKCAICGKMQQNLKQHMYTHTGVKVHTCSYCGKGFSQLGNFKNHLNIHTGNKPYSCTFSQCNKSFAEPNSLKMHMISHTGDKKYHCNICDKYFGYSHTLSAHKATHSLEKNYKCEECNKAFGSA